MRPLKPYIFVDGETLSIRKCIDNLHRSIKDLTYLSSRSVIKSHFIVDWSGVTNTTTQQEATFQFLNGGSNSILIYAVEFQVTGNAATGTVTLNGPAGAIATINCAAADPAGTRYRSLVQLNITNTTTTDFYVTCSAATLTQSIRATFYYRTVRKLSERYLIGLPRLTTGMTPTSFASLLNSRISYLAGEVTADSSANEDFRYEVYTARNDTASPMNNEQFHIPQEGRRIDFMHLVFCGPVGTTLRARLIETAGAGATILTCTCAGAGTGTVVTNTDSTGATELSNITNISSNNLRLVLDRTAGAGTIVSAFVIIGYK